MKLISYTFILFFFTSSFQVQAQENVNELIEQGSKLATEANKQLAAGNYEAAAENFEKAAQKFVDAGMPAQANAEWINAGAAYDNAANDESGKDNHASAADLYDKAVKASKKGGMVGQAASSERNRDASRRLASVQNTVGTGNTTGHIATINIQNKGDRPLSIAAQTFFIPSSGKHQSYVGSTPNGITVAPGQTAQVPVHGFCTDIHTPPVGNGVSMPSLDNWVPVVPSTSNQNPVETSDNTPSPVIITFGTEPVSGFDFTQRSSIINSPGFTKVDLDSETAFTITWPGTDVTIAGTLDPNSDPIVFASLMVDIVDRIERATVFLQEDGLLATPFSADPIRERESVIQQTIWVNMGILTGKEYTKGDFSINIYDQFEERTGTPVSALNDENKEKVDEGVDDFWGAFTLTGSKAKVFKKE